MTNIEKQFFEAFGIEPKHYDGCKLEDKYFSDETIQKQYITFDDYLAFECPYSEQQCYADCQYAYDISKYPSITDRVLLELIIMFLEINNLYKYYPDVEALKKDILNEFIARGKNKIIKEQIRALFREEK